MEDNVIMIHKDLSHLKWFCGRVDDGFESCLINEKTKEVIKKKIEEREVEEFKKYFEKMGWIIGHIPPLVLRDEKGETLHEFQV